MIQNNWIWKFHLTSNLENYTSFFTGIYDNDIYRKPVRSLSPFNMKLVNSTHNDRKIEIVSAELKQNVSFCEKQNLHETLIKCIQMKINAACNGKQICEQLTWYEPKFVNISFSCKG